MADLLTAFLLAVIRISRSELKVNTNSALAVLVVLLGFKCVPLPPSLFTLDVRMLPLPSVCPVEGYSGHRN